MLRQNGETDAMPTPKPKPKPKAINVALQGGGAHGAFAWGVLDAIAEDGRVEIDGLSATSAGAMNAAVYAYGNMTGGPDGARECLHRFWEDISHAGQMYSPVKKTVWDLFLGGVERLDQSLSYLWFDSFTKMFSPYEFNPLNVNPLRDVLERHVDFGALVDCQSTKMFICATNVRTNKIKVFRNREISADAVLASACLPMLFQAVEIDGEAYWDGGYMGNPALYPLVYHTETDDIVIIHVNPIERDEIPKRANEIANRVNEISFNSSLLREMRTFDFVKRIVEEEWIRAEFRNHFKFDRLNMHAIRADEVTGQYTVASKFSPDWDFLCNLRDKGRAVTKAWLKEHYKHIGKRSTLDLRREFE